MPAKVYVLIPPTNTGALPVVYGAKELMLRAGLGYCQFPALPVDPHQEDLGVRVFAVMGCVNRQQMATILETYLVE